MLTSRYGKRNSSNLTLEIIQLKLALIYWKHNYLKIINNALWVHRVEFVLIHLLNRLDKVLLVLEDGGRSIHTSIMTITDQHNDYNMSARWSWQISLRSIRIFSLHISITTTVFVDQNDSRNMSCYWIIATPGISSL